MKKTIGTLTLLTLLFSACGSRNNPSPEGYQEINEPQVNSTLTYVEESETLNELLRKQEAPAQTFQVSSKKPANVTGKQGTVVHIRPDNLETVDGQPVGDKIDVELKECTHQEALLRSNVQTVSNGQLLVSGGAYYINMTSDGKQLKLKNGKTLAMDFPQLTDDEMELFYGQRDSLGGMNWMPAQQKLVEVRSTIEFVVALTGSSEFVVALTGSSPDVIFEVNNVSDTVKNFSQEEFDKAQAKRAKEKKKREELKERMYNSIEINQLGWINCDHFYNNADEKTDVKVELENKDATQMTPTVAVWLIFKDINSIMNSYYIPAWGANYFLNIPIGYDVRLIAFTVDKDANLYTYSCDFKIKKDEKKSIKLQKTDDADFGKLFDLSNYCGEASKKVTVVN